MFVGIFLLNRTLGGGRMVLFKTVGRVRHTPGGWFLILIYYFIPICVWNRVVLL